MAGKHRTGMVALGLLRIFGWKEEEAFSKIEEVRKVTFEGLKKYIIHLIERNNKNDKSF